MAYFDNIDNIFIDDNYNLNNIHNTEHLYQVIGEGSPDSDIKSRRPIFDIIPGNLLSAKIGIDNLDWGVVASEEYRNSIHAMMPPIKNRGKHILDPDKHGTVVGLYENIIPGHVYADWINLIMPRMFSLDLYVSPCLFHMLKDTGVACELVPHEHHLMTIWPRSWQGNNFVLTRGKLFKTVGNGEVELDGFMDGAELPFGLNKGIIHKDMKIKSMRRITSKHTIGVIHNNLEWNFKEDAIAYEPTISRPYTPSVMAQPFRRIHKMPAKFDYVKEEYEEKVLTFTKNKPYYTSMHYRPSVSSDFFTNLDVTNATKIDGNIIDVHTITMESGWRHSRNVKIEPTIYNIDSLSYDRKHWKATYKDFRSQLYEDHIINYNLNYDESINDFITIDNYRLHNRNLPVALKSDFKHILKMHYEYVSVAFSHSSRYRNLDTTLFRWDTNNPIHLSEFVYMPYNKSDYNPYHTGYDHKGFNNGLQGDSNSFYKDSNEGCRLNKNNVFPPFNHVIIDSQFGGIHNVRKLFPDDANITIDKLIIPWLDTSSEVIHQDHLNRSMIDYNKNIVKDELNKKEASKSIYMSVPLDYALNGANIGNKEELKAKWNYDGSPMIFKRKGGATSHMFDKDYHNYVRYDNYLTGNRKEYPLVFFCPYKLTDDFIKNKLKLKVGIMSEETFKHDMHTGNGIPFPGDIIAPDISGREFLQKTNIDPKYNINDDTELEGMNITTYYADVSNDINRPAVIHRDYMQPVPSRKHSSEMFKDMYFWKYCSATDKPKLYSDIYQEKYDDFYNMISCNMGGSNRQLISYPKTITMLSKFSIHKFSSDTNVYTDLVDKWGNNFKNKALYASSNVYVYNINDDKYTQVPNDINVNDYYDIKMYGLRHNVTNGGTLPENYLTKIVIHDKRLFELYMQSGPDASVVAISNVPLFLAGASYIGGTFPPESEYQELIDQRYDLSKVGSNEPIKTVTPSYLNMSTGCFSKLSTGFELDDVFLENSQLFRYLSVYMQENTRKHNIKYRVNPHITEPMFRKGMTEFGNDIVVKDHPDYDFNMPVGTRDTNNVVNYTQDMTNWWYKTEERVYPFMDFRWCMQFAYDDLPKTVNTIKGVNFGDSVYIPDNVFPEQVNTVVLNPNHIIKCGSDYKSLVQNSALWISKPFTNKNGIFINKEEYFKNFLIFSDKNNKFVNGGQYEQYYEWSIDNKVSGVQTDAINDKYARLISDYENDNFYKHNFLYPTIYEIVTVYNSWVVADTSVGQDDDIYVKIEINGIAHYSNWFGGKLLFEFNGKVKDFNTWSINNIKYDFDSNDPMIYVYFVRNIRVYSNVYVCPSPNWERGMWGILRGVLPKGTDTRCVCIPQRCTEGIFFRDVHVNGVVLGEYNGSLPEKLFWGTKKEKLNINGIFCSTFNANPNSHRTRKPSVRILSTPASTNYAHTVMTNSPTTRTDATILHDYVKGTTLLEELHNSIINNKYGVNMFKLNTPYIILDEENTLNMNKIFDFNYTTAPDHTRINAKNIRRILTHNNLLWNINKRIEHGNIHISYQLYAQNPNKDGREKNYFMNTRASVTTINDVSPFALPHKFDEIDITNLGGFGDLYEYYSEDLFGITPQGYPNHRPTSTYVDQFVFRFDQTSAPDTRPLMYFLAEYINAYYNSYTLTQYTKGGDINGFRTVYAGNDNIIQAACDSLVKEFFPTGIDNVPNKAQQLHILTNSYLRTFRRPLRLYKSRNILSSIEFDKLFSMLPTTTEFAITKIKHHLRDTSIINRYQYINNKILPRDYPDMWVNFTGSDIYSERFKATGDTMYVPTVPIPVSSIFSKYTNLNGIAKTKKITDYVFSEHQSGVMYDWYDRYSTTKFDQTEFDQSYYIIQSNIRRSNIYKVYHQNADYSAGELSRLNYTNDGYTYGYKIINSIYEKKHTNIRSVLTTGGVNSIDRYSKSSMYYRSTLINETVGEIYEVNSPTPIVGPFYYMIHDRPVINIKYITELFKSKNLNYSGTYSIFSDVYNNVSEGDIYKVYFRKLLLGKSKLNDNVNFKIAKIGNTGLDSIEYTSYNVYRKRANSYLTARDLFKFFNDNLSGTFIPRYKLEHDTPIYNNKFDKCNLRDITSPTFSIERKDYSFIFNKSSLLIPEYYSNWSCGNATSLNAILYGRGMVTNKKGSASDSGGNNAPNYPIAFPESRIWIYMQSQLSLFDNKGLSKYPMMIPNGFDYNSLKLFDSTLLNTLINAAKSDYFSPDNYKFLPAGILYRSDFTNRPSKPKITQNDMYNNAILNMSESLPLNIKSQGNLMRILGSRRIVHSIRYPYSENTYGTREVVCRYDTNIHQVLSNIQAINSQMGDMDEVIWFEDVTSMCTELAFSNELLGTETYRAISDSPANIAPFVKKMYYTNISKTIRNHILSYKMRSESDLDISKPDHIILDEVVKHNDIPVRFLEYKYATNLPANNYRNANYNPYYLNKIDALDSGIFKPYTAVNDKNAHKNFNVNSEYIHPSNLISLDYALGFSFHNRHIGKWDNYNGGHFVYLPNAQCLEELYFVNPDSCVNVLLGANRLKVVQACGAPFKIENNNFTHAVGRFQLYPFMPDSGLSVHATSVWRERNMDVSMGVGYENKVKVNGQFLFSGIGNNRGYIKNIIHRTYGTAVGYPSDLKLDIWNTFNYARIYENNVLNRPAYISDVIVKGGTTHNMDVVITGSPTNFSNLHVQYYPIHIGDRIDLYDLIFRYMQYAPLNPRDVNMGPHNLNWTVNPSSNNNLRHIVGMHSVAANLTTRYYHYAYGTQYIKGVASSTFYVQPEGKKHLATIHFSYSRGSTRYQVHDTHLAVLRTPYFLSSPFYIPSNMIADRVFRGTNLSKSETPQVVSRESGSPSSISLYKPYFSSIRANVPYTLRDISRVHPALTVPDNTPNGTLTYTKLGTSILTSYDLQGVNVHDAIN